MTRMSLRLVCHPTMWFLWAFALGLPAMVVAMVAYMAAQPPRALYRSLR